MKYSKENDLKAEYPSEHLSYQNISNLALAGMWLTFSQTCLENVATLGCLGNNAKLWFINLRISQLLIFRSSIFWGSNINN